MGIIQQIQQFLSNLLKWWVILTPWQQGVRVRFGKHVKLLHTGIHLKLPLVDIVYMQPIRVRSHYIEDQTITLKCGKTITIASSLQYEIDDLLKLYDTLHNAHDTIEQKVKGAIFKFLSTKKLEDIELDECVDQVTASIDLGQYGLNVISFEITDYAVNRTYRLINSGIGKFTGYDQRLETVSTINGNKAQ